MQVTISDWTRRRAEAFRRLSEKTKRDAARRLQEPPFRIICCRCWYWWDQMAPERDVAAFFFEEDLRCPKCGDSRLTMPTKEATRLRQIIDR